MLSKRDIKKKQPVSTDKNNNENINENVNGNVNNVSNINIDENVSSDVDTNKNVNIITNNDNYENENVSTGKFIIKVQKKEEEIKRATYYLKESTILRIEEISHTSNIGKSELVQKILEEALKNIEIRD